jgi:predicted PurR-regulated permease PerM
MERPTRRLSKRFHGNKIIASSILMCILAVIILAILGVISYKVFLETKSFITNYDYYMDIANNKLGDVCDRMDGWMGLKCGETIGFINSNVDQFEGKIQEKVIPAIVDGSIPLLLKMVTLIAIFFIILMSVVYISKDFEKIREWREHSMFASEAKVLADKLNELTKVYFKVQLFIMILTGIICVFGLFLIGNPYAIILGIVIGILDALPMFGTGTVLIPWSVVMVLTGHFFDAAVLFTIYIITYLLRELMESKYMGDRLGIAPFTMMVIIYMGLVLYGLWGFILGPVSYVIIKTMILYLKTQLERGKLSKI